MYTCTYCIYYVCAEPIVSARSSRFAYCTCWHLQFHPSFIVPRVLSATPHDRIHLSSIIHHQASIYDRWVRFDLSSLITIDTDLRRSRLTSHLSPLYSTSSQAYHQTWSPLKSGYRLIGLFQWEAITIEGDTNNECFLEEETAHFRSVTRVVRSMPLFSSE